MIEVINDDASAGEFIQEQIADQDGIDVDHDITISQDISSPTKHSYTTPKSTRHTIVQHSSQGKSLNISSNNGTQPSTPTTHKQNLRQLRIEKTASTTGNLSGRKMWSEEETKSLVKIWEEESARVWASAGKKVLSLQRISDLLQHENIDRDVSQVEGKIKALKRDFKQIKQDRAIQTVQQRMAPYLDKLEKIFSREQE